MTAAHNLISKLGIGTVQFGLDYGISNSVGKTKLGDVTNILQHAADEGVVIIDTAHGYGDSEKVLGQTLPKTYTDLKLITKTPAFDGIETQVEAVAILEAAFQNSLKYLKQDSIYGLMVHAANDLLGTNADGLYDAMRSMKNDGLVKKIGVSAYDQNQIERIITRYNIDIVQVPVNIFDQRLIQSGVLQMLKEKQIEIHSRSAFLQGLIFMPADTLPHKLDGLKPALEKLQSFCKNREISLIEAALAYVFNNDYIDHVICGTNSQSQFLELFNTIQNLPNILLSDFEELAVKEDELLNPAKWNI